jgi:serine/threonine-protein kinase
MLGEIFGFNKVPRLLGKYANADEKERRIIMAELAKTPESAAQGALESLTSGALGIGQVADILGSFKDRAMFDFLLEQFNSIHEVYRIVAFRVIREKWGPLAAPAMVELLSSEDRNIRKMAAELLIDHPTSKIPIYKIGALLQNPERDVVRNSINVLVAIASKEAVKVLSRGLGEPDSWTRKKILDAVKKLNAKESVEMIRELLKTEDDNTVIVAALETLQVVGSPEDAREVLQLITSEDMTTRQLAAEVVCNIGDSTVVQDVVELMRSRDVDTRRLASYILYSVKDPRTGKVLIDALRDADWWVREIAVEALAKIEIGGMREVLLGLLADPDPYIRRIAAEYYCHVSNPEAFNGLVNLLDDEDWWTRERSIMALGKSKDPRALGPVLKRINDKDVRLSIPDTIAEIGTPQAKLALMKLLDSKDKALRLKLVSVSVKIGGPEGRKMLNRLLKDKEPKVAEEAEKVVDELKTRSRIE